MSSSLDGDLRPANSVMDTSSGSQDEAEPCTQPLTEDAGLPDSQEAMDVEDTPQTYGYLFPLRPQGTMIRLEQDVFTVGRSTNNTHKISDKFKNHAVVSKVHFIIRKEERPSGSCSISIQDKSSNGTYINGKIIGKERSQVLMHNDVIGIEGDRVKNFIFMSTNKEYLNKYPEVLRGKYMVSKELGKGACGTVFLAVRKSDHSSVAIKEINKKQVSMAVAVGHPPGADNIMNEVRLLRKIDHPCIIRLEDVVETSDKLYIVLELADGGELFDKIIAKTKFQEAEAKLHFYQMLSAIDYLHKQNIAHRDLKPENILLCSQDDLNPVIKVTDLGLSKFVDVHTHLKTFCGTPQYLAPEVLFSRVRGDGSYDLKVDCWSLGVILYILLCGCPPFNPDRKDKPLIRQVTEGDYSFPARMWGNISKEAVDLVKRLMAIDPKKRLSAAEALNHEWMRDPPVVRKAVKLMATQRSGWSPMETSTSALNGILPESESEWNSVVQGNGDEPRAKRRRANGDEGTTETAGEGGCKRQRRTE